MTDLLSLLLRTISQQPLYASQEEFGTLLELFPNTYDVPYCYLTLVLTPQIPSNQTTWGGINSDYWGGVALLVSFARLRYNLQYILYFYNTPRFLSVGLIYIRILLTIAKVVVNVL